VHGVATGRWLRRSAVSRRAPCTTAGYRSRVVTQPFPLPTHSERASQWNTRRIDLQFGDNIQTARQLRNAVFAKFFDKS